MAAKGDKEPRVSELKAAELEKQMKGVDGISLKKMFGGFGIFHEDKMFGLIDSKGVAFLKIDETTQVQYEDRGSVRHSRMPYFSIPDEIFTDAEQLQSWTKKSIEISK